ncbi:Tyrosine-protein kinase ptk [bacterium HR39]|nr:Tyrosine-protein kinase ptk [bacterium HR39]
MMEAIRSAETTPEARPAGRPAPYHPAPVHTGGPDPRGIVLFLKRRRGIILSCALLGGLAGALFGYGGEPTYSASALVLLQPKNADVVDVEAVLAGRPPEASFIETQIRLAKSPAFLGQVVDRLRLVPDDPEELRRIAEAEAAKPATARLSWLERFLPAEWLLATGLASDAPVPEAGEIRERLRRARMSELQDGLEVRREGSSLILSVTFTSTDPQRAARFANGIAEIFVEQQAGDRVAALRAAADWLATRTKELAGELRSLEKQIQEYRARHQMLQGQAITPETEQAQALTELLVKTRAERREKEARLLYIQSLLRRGESLNALSEVLQSPYMQSLWEQERELSMQEADLLTRYGDKHPVVVKLRAEKARLRAQQQQEIARIVDNLRNEIAVIAERERSIEADIRELTGKSTEAAQAAVKLRELEREAEATRKVYEELLQKQKEVEAKLKMTEPGARIVAHAEPPGAPSSPPPYLFGFVGFLGSGLLGLGLAWLRERFDSGLRSPREVEALFGLPCFALVPELDRATLRRYGSPHAYLAARPLSTFAESIRAIHTALATVDIDHPPRVIQITSSVPGEGKTTTGAALGASLSREGNRVILVDLDLRHPALYRLFPGESRASLVDVLTGRATLEDAMRHDERTGVDVLPTLKPADNPGAVLTSRRLRELLASLRERYDYVLLDSTPVLGVTDAKRTADLAEATLFLIRWEKTDADTVEDALDELRKHGRDAAGFVLTLVDARKLARYGYGGVDRYYTKYRKYYVD